MSTALERSSGRDGVDAWATACADSGLDPSLRVMDVDQLAAGAAALSRQSGRAGLVGRSLSVRIASYQALAAGSAVRPAPPWDWARVATDELLRQRMTSAARYSELLALDPFDPELRRRMDHTAAQAANRTGAPIGLVNIVLDGAVEIVGSWGMSAGWPDRAGGVPIEWSFCARIVRTREPYVVPDSTQDVLHRFNPVVVHDGAGAYAGAPLITSRGEVLGSCCVVSDQPRAFTTAEVTALEEIAADTVATLEELRRPQLAAAG